MTSHSASETLGVFFILTSINVTFVIYTIVTYVTFWSSKNLEFFYLGHKRLILGVKSGIIFVFPAAFFGAEFPRRSVFHACD